MTVQNFRGFPNLLQTVFRLIASTEVWVVVLLVAASVPTARLLPFTLTIAAGYWVVRWLAFGRPSVRTPTDIPITLLITMLPISLWITTEHDLTQDQIRRLLSGIFLYYALVNWSSTRWRMRLLLYGFYLAGIALAASALVSIRWSATDKLPFIPSSLYERLPLLVSDIINPNVMAGALVVLLPLVVALPLFAMASIRWFEWPILLFALVSMILILVLTQSRGGLLAFSVALMTLLILCWRYGFILASALIIVTAVSLRTEWGLGQLQVLTSASTYGGLDTRLMIWSRASSMIQDYPLTGIGMGTFKQMLDTSYPLFQSTYSIPHAHNIVLQVAVDLGIPGLLAWLMILLLVTRGAWRVYRVGCTRGDAWVSGLGAGLIASQLALITHGMVDAVTWGMVRPAVIVWALWGLAAASERVLVVNEMHPAPQSPATNEGV